MHRCPLSRLALVAAAVTLVGCDAGDAPAAEEELPGTTELDAEAEFAPVNRSGVTGTIAADHDGDAATISVDLAGLEEGTVYPVHIHTGLCAAGGPVAVPLGRITGGNDGSGRLTARVAASQLAPDQPAFVQVHGSSGAAIACADIAGHEGEADALTERMDEDSVPAADGDGA